MDLFLRILLLTCLLSLKISAEASPKLLKNPKVYNVVVTSDQNLQPSQAYPVVQPVAQSQVVGYYPPYYGGYYPYPYGAYGPYGPYGPYGYGPWGPYGPYDPVPLVPGVPFDPRMPYPNPNQPANPQPADNPNTESVSKEMKEVSINFGKQTDGSKNSEVDDMSKEEKDKDKDRVPLTFYPSTQSSVYFNPYYYGHNLPPHVPPPGTYYLNYQPAGPIPVPAALLPQQPPSTRLAPQENSAKRPANIQEAKETKQETQTKIPDVPPPPVPTKKSL
ncbi:uncharacterized protein LOC103575750 [Microplitis demolitor]|uniref:uncharacterized protein LOC103575750 n=1 Tax=Microplitis demolitor TaxID=69319 RepID=UPI00043FFE5B|nr:uncharacterized protein LOC103575750 [Microplitis demolitor]